MAWIEDELLRQGGARIVSHQGGYRPLSRRHRFRFDNGLYVTTVMGIDDSLVFHYTLMGRADGTILTPEVGDHAKFERTFRGYRRRRLGHSRKPVDGLPPELSRRLAQVTGGLAVAGWWLVLTECTAPRLLERGFPAWRVTCLTLGENVVGRPRRLFRHFDSAACAGRILSQVDAMRRLLEDVHTWAALEGPERR